MNIWRKKLFTQDIFFYIVVIFFFASFQKAAFIMAIVVQVSNMAYGPLGLSYESVYVQLFNSEHPESEPCEDRKYLRSFKTLNRHIAVSSLKKC